MVDILTINYILILLYTILAIAHISISYYWIHTGKKELGTGVLKNFLSALLMILCLGLLFFIWSISTKFGVLKIENPIYDLILTNLLAIGFLMAMAYMAFLSRDIGKKFGFIKVGKKISEKAKKFKK